jgi:hypothetical protein
MNHLRHYFESRFNLSVVLNSSSLSVVLYSVKTCMVVYELYLSEIL